MSKIKPKKELSKQSETLKIKKLLTAKTVQCTKHSH